ncbi:fimbrial protein [Pusillimonas sp. SM2304]|uniref:fimbrial protein n=1 Tax=Pusillimonas sp. SM2304 TaxID=3073241 RepID=UPI002876296A|nr:fimbrial protein [Pusillimonas sp. SM2304]MDS1138899.1 fimbrial protein [Pusillimonas sp. SM2304]
MKQFIKLLFLGLALIISKESFALACGVSNSSVITMTAQITPTVAVPPTLPIGSVIWRSPKYLQKLKCWQDYRQGPESVYLYLNITDPNQTQLGGQIEIGLNYGGKDYFCSSPSMQSGGFCRMELPIRFNGCSDDNGCPYWAQAFDINFQFFIAKKSDGMPGQEGSLPNMPSSYLAVQFNGVNGVNANPNKNFSVYLEGFNNLRYVGCSSTVDVIPRTINFDRVGTFSAQSGATIQELPLLITAVKDCAVPYGLGGSFLPVSGTLADVNTTLVPVNNNSVGIQILKTEDGKPIVFNTEFPIAPLNNRDLYVEKNLTAKLFWRSNTPVIGDFNASVKLEIYYK